MINWGWDKWFLFIECLCQRHTVTWLNTDGASLRLCWCKIMIWSLVFWYDAAEAVCCFWWSLKSSLLTSSKPRIYVHWRIMGCLFRIAADVQYDWSFNLHLGVTERSELDVMVTVIHCVQVKTKDQGNTTFLSYFFYFVWNTFFRIAKLPVCFYLLFLNAFT